MDDLSRVLAENISELRKSNNLTQAEFAERLNDSDKAVSKWERGDSLPDVIVLKTIADMYGVGLDDMLRENGVRHVVSPDEVLRDEQLTQKILITALWVTMVWIVAAVVFLYSQYSRGTMFWMAFVWAVPVSFLVALIFARRWGAADFKRISCILSSGFVWSALISFYFQFMSYNIWMIFFIGVPVQIALILSSKIHDSSRSLRSKSGK